MPGVLADVYKAAPPLNIVFAEAVTVDSGSRHDARLLLEPYYREFGESDDEVATEAAKQIGKLENSLQELDFSDFEVEPVNPDHIEPIWTDTGTIELGWVNVEGLWDALATQAQASSSADEYDLETAVISADTERRILRYVVPRKGAVSVSVKHRDQPGAMGEIAEALAGNRLNILSSLLRRGSAAASKAEVVMVVEPTGESVSREEVEMRARIALAELPYKLQVRVNVWEPVPAEEVLYPRRPHEIAVRPSIALEAEIRTIHDELPVGKRPIFISRRFVDPADDYSRHVVQELQDALAQYGCVAVEAKPQGGNERAAPDTVKARMWACDAAILLVVSTPSDEHQFSVNLAHECGFMQGQGKPLLPLVQTDVVDDVVGHANMQGLQLSTFSRDSAMNRQRLDSIHGAVRQWIAAEFPSQFETLVAEGDSSGGA
jgi:nucleoside 2-deoxyribosyltransferase